MKLTKLYVHNYKSFYDTTIELGKFNIVVGENNSGKSNLIDVLEFINIAMTKDIQRAINDKGGYDNIRNYNTKENKVIIRATFEKNDSKKSKYFFLGKMGYEGLLQGDGEFTFSFSFSKQYSIFSIYLNMDFIATTNEQLISEYQKNNHKNIKKLKTKNTKFIISNKINFSNINSTKLFIDSQADRKFIKENLFGILLYIGILSDKNLTIKKDNFSNFDNYISTYYFNTDIIKDKSHQDSIVELKKDGSNLGKNLSYIKEVDKNQFEIISNSLITTIDEIDGINLIDLPRSYPIFFQEKEQIPINIVSDGTINLLATITALEQPRNKNSLLVFEEPERHLHLKAVNYMLRCFRASDKQILITTHSSEILKLAELYEIIFIYRDSDGDTQSMRADEIPDLKGRMKRLSYERDLTLDELINCDMVGNFE